MLLKWKELGCIRNLSKPVDFTWVYIAAAPTSLQSGPVKPDFETITTSQPNQNPNLQFEFGTISKNEFFEFDGNLIFNTDHAKQIEQMQTELANKDDIIKLLTEKLKDKSKLQKNNIEVVTIDSSNDSNPPEKIHDLSSNSDDLFIPKGSKQKSSFAKNSTKKTSSNSKKRKIPENVFDSSTDSDIQNPISQTTTISKLSNIQSVYVTPKKLKSNRKSNSKSKKKTKTDLNLNELLNTQTSYNTDDIILDMQNQGLLSPSQNKLNSEKSGKTSNNSNENTPHNRISENNSELLHLHEDTITPPLVLTVETDNFTPPLNTPDPNSNLFEPPPGNQEIFASNSPKRPFVDNPIPDAITKSPHLDQTHSTGSNGESSNAIAPIPNLTARNLQDSNTTPDFHITFNNQGIPIQPPFKLQSDYVYWQTFKSTDLSNYTPDQQNIRAICPPTLMSTDEMSKLPPWNIPGLIYNFGETFTRHEAIEKLYHGFNTLTGLPTVTQINKDLEEQLMALSVNIATTAYMTARQSRELGKVFYDHYKWIDETIAMVGPKELDDYLYMNDALSLRDHLAPWPCTAFPINPELCKYWSVVRGETEYVCRTKAAQQRIPFYRDDTRIFKCCICEYFISTDLHTFVNVYVYNEDATYIERLSWQKTFLKACFIHFLIEGKKLEDRNCFAKRSTGAPTQASRQSTSRLPRTFNNNPTGFRSRIPPPPGFFTRRT